MKEYWILKSKTKPTCQYVGRHGEGWVERRVALQFNVRADVYRAVAESIDARRLTVVHVTVKPKRPEPSFWVNAYGTTQRNVCFHHSKTEADKEAITSARTECFPLFRVRRWETP